MTYEESMTYVYYRLFQEFKTIELAAINNGLNFPGFNMNRLKRWNEVKNILHIDTDLSDDIEENIKYYFGMMCLQRIEEERNIKE